MRIQLLFLCTLAMANVVITDGENYPDLIKDSPVAILIYCQAGKEYCDQLQPEINKALSDVSTLVTFANIDCAVSKCGQITMFPTIRVFNFGKLLIPKFEGEKTYSTWVKLANKIIDPYLKVNETVAKVYLITNDHDKNFKLSFKFLDVEFIDIKNQDHIILGAGKNSNIIEAKEETFYSYQNSQYCIPLKAEYKCPPDQTQLLIPIASEGIVIVNPEEMRIIYLNSTAYSNDFIITQYTIPFIGDFTKDAADTIFIYEKKGIVMYTTNTTESSNLEKALRKAAMLHNADVSLFVIADPESDLGGRMFGYLGLSRKELPLLLGVSFDKRSRKSTVHQFIGDASVENVDSFIKGWLNGSLKRRYKSEDIPERQLSSTIKKVVSKNFEDEVINKPHDVMVKFFSPGCGACIKFKPIYQKLADDYKNLNNGTIEFMEINILQNEVEGNEIKYYPTIKYFAEGNKGNPSTFSGREKTYDKMVEFIKMSASKNVVHPETKAKTDL